jgi:hypothetical protein
MDRSERSLCDRIIEFMVAYKRVEPGPVKLAILNRKYNRSSLRFGRSLMQVLESDGRFHFALLKGGASTVRLKSDLESQRAQIDAMFEGLDDGSQSDPSEV